MRYIYPHIKNDLQKKMVFIGGPRQAGKTTLAKSLIENEDFKGQYFSWDRIKDKKAILREEWSDEATLLIFDEIHKYPKWKNIVKGYYDSFKEKHKFLVTGSARLDLYRRGGDSLFGRYHYWRLHPFTLDELPKGISPDEGFKRLMLVGGFPEPFLHFDEREARRWRADRYDKILREDIRDLHGIKKIDDITFLVELLKERVGGEIVVNNLAQDLHVSPVTVAKWIESLEKMYLIFCVHTYTRGIPRALNKPFKAYFFDNADVDGTEGARFENFVAGHLLKRCHFEQDYTGRKIELCYIRDREKREVDFALVEDGKARELIECKLNDETPAKSIHFFKQKTRAQKLNQIVGGLKKDYTKNGIHFCSPFSYFKVVSDVIREM